MRVILSAFLGKGDVYPFLGFGRALGERGHRVAMITSANFRDDVAEAGLDYIELASADVMAEILGAFEQAHDGLPCHRIEQAIDAFLALVLQRLYLLIEEHQVRGETVVGTMMSGFGAHLAHEKLGVPLACLWHIPHHLRLAQPSLPGMPLGLADFLRNTVARCTWLGRKLRRSIDAFRGQLGLPRLHNLVGQMFRSPQLNIGLFPGWFAPRCHGWSGNTLLADFPLYVRNQDCLPEQLEEFLGRGDPPVVFSNASWRSRVDEYFEASAAACRSLGKRAVLLTDRKLRLPAGENAVICVGYASLKALLPRSAGVVHHGGTGTIALALACGTPQLLVPSADDQPSNARLVRDLGAGLIVPPRRYARQGAAALESLLESASIRAQCRRLTARFQGSPNFEEACRRMEHLLGR